MHIHITGICGTFMGGVAQLACAAGHQVTGSDANVYPPMDGQLRSAGIRLMHGYRASNLKPEPDMLVIGNAISRGNEEVEYALDRGINYISGAQWLSQYVLQQQWVVAVAGTHGKTTTSSMLAWILDYAGLEPGFLIGGVPGNFGVSARAGAGSFFVVEADEYDTAFFDKRSKFVHYRPRTQVLNNLEFDHGDIFSSIGDIQRQFHHLIRTIPASGLIVTNGDDTHLEQVLQQGCWSQVERFAKQRPDAQWRYRYSHAGTSLHHIGNNEWQLSAGLEGEHNIANATAAVAAARHVGVPVSVSIDALARFEGVKRRLELLATIDDVRLYDDFAHHPTAIAATLKALRPLVVDGGRLIALIDFRSNSMASGIHLDAMPVALQYTDIALLYNAQPERLDLTGLCAVKPAVTVHTRATGLTEQLVQLVAPNDVVVLMSNGAFAGVHQDLLTMLSQKCTTAVQN